MPTFPNLDTWLQRAEAQLSQNRISIDGYRYTAPSLDTGDFGRKDYANQFLWDSCFHAIMWRRFDPKMAQDELLALASRQVKDGPDAGMIPHCNYWQGGGEWLWKHDERSSITQPPLMAVAGALIYEQSGDLDFVASLYESVSRYHEWFDRRRDPDGDGLVALIHPWESGGDVLPRWDHAMGYPQPFDHETWRTARHDFAHTVVEYDTDAAKLAQIGSFYMETIDYNAIRAADMDAMATFATALGRPDEAARWTARAERIRAAFQAKMIADGLPCDLEGPDETPVIQPSAGQFMTLVGGCVTPEQAEALVAQLMQPNFWTTYPVPTSPIDADNYNPGIYWRGNVWPCVNWLIYKGLRRYGFDAIADALAERTYALIELSDFWEYYHPETGEGLGGTRFSWATVLLDIVADTAERG
jgi:alpha,alpha-trehalase